MIRSKPPNDAYREAYDRVFRAPATEPDPYTEIDACIADISAKMQAIGGQPDYVCTVCHALVSDPENHTHEVG